MIAKELCQAQEQVHFQFQEPSSLTLHVKFDIIYEGIRVVEEELRERSSVRILLILVVF